MDEIVAAKVVRVLDEEAEIGPGMRMQLGVFREGAIVMNLVVANSNFCVDECDALLHKESFKPRLHRVVHPNRLESDARVVHQGDEQSLQTS